MILKINPSVISQNIPFAQRPKINLNASIFNLKFGVFDKSINGYVADPTIFLFELHQLKINSDPHNNTNKIVNSYERKFTKCTDEYLFGYCVEDDLEIEGYVDEYNTNFIALYILECNNQTSNVTCKSQTEIDNFFTEKTLGVVYQNHDFDFNDYENPIHNSSSADYIWLDSKMSKTLNIFIKKGVLIDNDNAFYQNPIKRETYIRDYIQTDYTQNVILNQSVPIGQIFIWSSNNQQQNQRIYQKIDQVFANLSGIANFFLIIGFFVVRFQQNLTFQKYLMFDLYDFEGYNDSIKEKHKEDNENKNKDGTKKKISETEVPNSCETRMNFNIPEKNILLIEDFKKTKLHFHKIKEKTVNDSFILDKFSKNEIPLEKIQNNDSKSKIHHPLNINILQYVKLMIKSVFKISLSLKEKAFLKYQNEYFNITNLKFIFKLFQDVEKLKMIYFNETQLNLFELLPTFLFSDNAMGNPVSESAILCRKYKNLSLNYERKLELSKNFISDIRKLNNINFYKKKDEKLISFFLNNSNSDK